jgi:hypothetical protein
VRSSLNTLPTLPTLPFYWNIKALERQGAFNSTPDPLLFGARDAIRGAVQHSRYCPVRVVATSDSPSQATITRRRRRVLIQGEAGARGVARDSFARTSSRSIPRTAASMSGQKAHQRLPPLHHANVTSEVTFGWNHMRPGQMLARNPTHRRTLSSETATPGCVRGVRVKGK